jgi:hypothetical protein
MSSVVEDAMIARQNTIKSARATANSLSRLPSESAPVPTQPTTPVTNIATPTKMSGAIT